MVALSSADFGLYTNHIFCSDHRSVSLQILEKIKMKKRKLIFWITGILLVICSGSYFFGFAGTRFTEKLWAVGTEEDYLVFPENRENILYQSGNDYYLKCEKRTYHRTPLYW